MAKTILVADDSKTIRHVVQLTFQATDYRVVGVDSGREAIERARAERPDLVLADVSMPGVDGYQVCQALKEGPTAHIPVVLMAGAFEAFDERRAHAARADGHIKKPFETQKLLDQVNALTARPPVPAPVAVAPVAVPAPVAASTAPAAAPFAAAAPPLAAPASPFGAPTPSFGAPAPSPFGAPAPSASPFGAPSFGAPAPSASPFAAAPQAASPFGAPAPSASPFGGSVASDLAPPPNPFRAPVDESRAAAPVAASSSWEEQPIEEVEPIDDAEPLDEAEMASPGYGPSLEPPSPPDPEAEAHRRSVDVWALTDGDSEPAAPAAARAAPRRPSFEAPAPVPGYGFDEEAEPQDEASFDPGPTSEDEEAPSPHAGAVANLGVALAPAIADQAAGALPAGLPREELLRVARSVIEEIAWEVVPELAETIIREEIRRLLAERG